MARISLTLAVVFLSATFVVESDGKTWRRKLKCMAQSFRDTDKCFPCDLFKPRQVTLTIRNNLKEPFFEETVVLNCTNKKTLFDIMQDAADVDPKFRFSSKYYNRELGFYIQAINHAYGTYDEDNSWWEILDGELQRTPVGASSYKPAAGETVTFNLTNASYSH